MKKLLLVVISILLVAPAPARSADQPPEAALEHPGADAAPAVPPETPLHLDLGEVLEKVLEANPGLQALSRRQAAAEKQASAAGRKRWGNLDAFFNYVQNNDDLLIRPMSWQMISGAGGFEGLPWDSEQFHWGLNYSVALYLGGELSRNIRIADLESDKARELLNGGRWQLRFNALSLYTAAGTFDAVGSSLDDLIRSLEKTRQRLDLMVELGKRPPIDRLKVIEQLEDARAERESIRADRIRAGALLLALMGEDPSRGIEVSSPPAKLPAATLSRSELRSAALENSAIRKARLDLEQSRNKVGTAHAAFIPKIIASGSYQQHGGITINEHLDTWQVSLGVAIPILHGGSRFEELAATEHRRDAAESGLSQTRLDVLSRLEEALARFDAARAEIRAAKARVAAGDEAARIEEIRYDSGAGTIEDLLLAQARRQAAVAALARARGTVLTAAETINTIVEKEAMK